MVQAMQVPITAQQTPMRTTSLQRVAPQQLYTPTTAPAQFDISTLLSSIMPLIMIMMMFGMMRPMMSGMAGGG